MLEDESGRISLVGERVLSACLVTGVIPGALGIETSNGDFEVVDLCFPGMAPQPSAGLPWPSRKAQDESMDVDGEYISPTFIQCRRDSNYIKQVGRRTQHQMSGSRSCLVWK